MAKFWWCCCLVFGIVTQTQADLVSEIDQLKYEYSKNKDKKNLVVVFDIDDTILSNKLIIGADGGYYLDRVIGHQRFSNLPSIKKQKDIYDWCIKHNVGVVFITFRCESERLSTIKNLKEQNITRWRNLILFPMPCNYKDTTALAFKTSVRQDLTKKGVHILAAIGDQYSDVEGGYTDLSIKLDDPGYYTQ